MSQFNAIFSQLIIDMGKHFGHNLGLDKGGKGDDFTSHGMMKGGSFPPRLISILTKGHGRSLVGEQVHKTDRPTIDHSARDALSGQGERPSGNPRSSCLGRYRTAMLHPLIYCSLPYIYILYIFMLYAYIYIYI